MRKLIYIIGAGRSGTTLMDIVLGNAENALSLGEINRYPLRRGNPRLSDPPPEETARLWAEFRQRLEKRLGEPLDFDALQRLLRRNEYHFGFIASVLGREPGKEYWSFLKAFYETLFAVFPAPVLIDSSKYPSRAWHLSAIQTDLGIEVSYVYLKRDPIAVVRSFSKKGIEQSGKGWFSSNLYWALINLLCSSTALLLRRRGLQVCQVKFEDLVSQPVNTLRRIASDLNVDLERPIQIGASKGDYQIGPLFDGNRIRTQKTLSLEKAGARIEPKGLTERILRFIYLPLYQPPV